MEFPFVKNAFIVGVLIAFCSSLLGVTLVLKRFSFMGDGLSHVAFGTMAVAGVLQLSNSMLLVLPVTIGVAVVLLNVKDQMKMRGEAVLAMLSVGALAIGYMLMNLFSTSSNVSADVCSTLFGSTSILTLTNSEVWLCVIMSIVVLLTYCWFYHRIFAITFDEAFANATGIPVKRSNAMVAIITAIIIVLAMNLVGSLLVSALIIFPSMTAMQLCKNFKGVICIATILSVLCAVIGILCAILYSTPVGSTIVVANLGLYVVACIVRKWIRR